MQVRRASPGSRSSGVPIPTLAATLILALTVYNWPHIAGGLALDAYFWPPTAGPPPAGRLRLDAYSWPPTTDRLVMAASYWPLAD